MREGRRDEAGETGLECRRGEGMGVGPEFVEAECKIDGRLPAIGSVVMVLQVLERRVVGA